jgi:hypothetical protein
MTFDLFFPKTPKGISDMEAETIWRGHPAYIYVVDPYDAPNMTQPGGAVDAGGRVLLTCESFDAEGCCAQIDSLIENLKKLKVKARREFERRGST